MTASQSKTSAASPEPHFVGIDVAKDSYVIHIRPLHKSRSFEQTAVGHRATIEWLQTLKVERIVLEATGGYERDLAWALLDAKFFVSVVNPQQSHHAAKALLQHDKSDRTDAEVLSWMAEHMSLRLAEKPAEKQLEMQELVTRRSQLIQMRVAEMNRCEHLRNKESRRSIQKHLDYMKKEIKRIEAAISKLIDSDDDWRRTAEILESATGVGEVISRTLIAELPELGNVNRQEITALAGLAPRLYESGKWKGERHIRGGRSTVRNALYMAALSAIRFNPVIKQHYIHLRKLGKLKKVAITACMRKLLIVLNTLLKTATPWRDVTLKQS
jgi:transposase